MKTIEFKSSNYCSVVSNKKSTSSIWILLVVGLFIGFINGFFGGGGGMICVPALTFILGLPDKKAHATTILIMLPLSIASFIVYLFNGIVKWDIAVIVSLGFAVGGIFGALLLNKINNVVLQFVFAFIIIFGGVKLIF